MEIMPPPMVQTDIDPINLDAPETKAALQRMDDLMLKATQVVVHDADSAATASDLARELQLAEKQNEQMRITLVKPIKDHAAYIDGLFIPKTKRLKEVRDSVNVRIKDYLLEEQRKAEAVARAEREKREAEEREAQRKADEARRKAEDEALALAAQAEDAGLSAVSEKILDLAVAQPARPVMPATSAAPPSVAAPARIKTAASSISRRMVWKYRVVNLQAVPVDLLSLNTFELNKRKDEAAKAGTIRKDMIPGIEFYQDLEIGNR